MCECDAMIDPAGCPSFSPPGSRAAFAYRRTGARVREHASWSDRRRRVPAQSRCLRGEDPLPPSATRRLGCPFAASRDRRGRGPGPQRRDARLDRGNDAPRRQPHRSKRNERGFGDCLPKTHLPLGRRGREKPQAQISRRDNSSDMGVSASDFRRFPRDRRNFPATRI